MSTQHVTLDHTVYRSSVYRTTMKRWCDIAIAAFAVAALGPLLLAIAILIKMDSPGPVIFKQIRVGSRPRRGDRNGEWEIAPFKVWKFRSMYADSDQSLHEQYIKSFVNGSVEPNDSDRIRFKLTDDPRVTRAGKWLRRTSLDELPQLFNVLRGEMSLVGPRPVPEYECADYAPWHWERLAARPGITGIWQVYGRGRVTFEEMVRMDIDYVRSGSFWLDLKLLALTIPAVLRGRGAE
jgi:lipopolysaccharide/colanic/teichoic acid biosynthesis glycosyltransferase